MLAAEVVATRAGKNLDFGDWDGDDDGKPWTRDLSSNRQRKGGYR
jgi:telomere length regulation protein